MKNLRIGAAILAVSLVVGVASPAPAGATTIWESIGNFLFGIHRVIPTPSPTPIPTRRPTPVPTPPTPNPPPTGAATPCDGPAAFQDTRFGVRFASYEVAATCPSAMPSPTSPPPTPSPTPSPSPSPTPSPAPSTYAALVESNNPCVFYRLNDSLASPLATTVLHDSSTNAANGHYNTGTPTHAGIVLNDGSAASTLFPGGAWAAVNEAMGPANVAAQQPTAGVQEEIWNEPFALGAQQLPAYGGSPGTVGAPSFVQYFQYMTTDSTSESSSTVTLGTSGSGGIAPVVGDTLVALVNSDGNFTPYTITPPAGWTTNPVANAVAWNNQRVFSWTVTGSVPSSVTFTYSGLIQAQITIAQIHATGGIDVVTSANANVTTPWTTTTGTGTQTGLNDRGLILVSMADGIIGGITGPTGYNALGGIQSEHGDGTNTFGGTAAAYVSNNALTAASVPAQTVTWNTGPAGTESVGGLQVLMKPASGGAGVSPPYQLSINSANHYVFSVNIGGTIHTAVSTTTIVAGTIYHVVGTYTGASLYITVNNSKQNVQSLTGSITGYDATNGMGIGNTFSNLSGLATFNGLMADLAVYCPSPGLISDAQITADFNLGTGATPAPTPSPSPSPTASPTPTPGPESTPSNGPDFPAGFVPYGATSIWNSPLPTATTFPYASDSTAVANQFFPGSDWGGPFPFISEPGEFDPSFQIYFAKTTDPKLTVSGCSSTGWFGANNCVGLGPGLDPGGAGAGKIYVPANMKVGGGNNDNVFGIVQPNGVEIDGYCFDTFDNGCFMPPGWSNSTPLAGSWTNGGTLANSGWMGVCGNFFTGAGWVGQTTVTGGATQGATVGQGGQCAGSGLLHPNELLSGSIPHALYLTAQCDQQEFGSVYPAAGFGGHTSCTGVLPTVGERIWYDVPCDASSPGHIGFSGTFTRSNSSLLPWEKAALCALNQYGGFILDNGSNTGTQGTGLGVRNWGEANAAVNGTTDPGSVLSAQSWTSGPIGGDWTPSIIRWWPNHTNGSGNWAPPGVTFNGHMHVLCESVTQGGSGCH